jgi:hypothetical protein
VVCHELGIGGDDEYFTDTDAHIGRIKVLYHEASDSTYVPRAVLFNFEPGVIGAAA